MKHQQILDKLALGAIPSLVQDETHMLARQSFYEAKHDGHRGARYAEVVPPLLRRWGPLMTRHGDQSELMTGHRVAIALATCLHKVGLIEPSLTERALRGIDELNDAVWLSDEFARQSPAYADLLRSTPPALSKAPAVREPLTFTRPGDLLAINTTRGYVLAHVHGDTGTNEAPILELYRQIYPVLPAADQVVGTQAAGEQLGNGPVTNSHIAVVGLRHIPDPADQILLLASGQNRTPDTSHLTTKDYLHTRMSLYEFLDYLESPSSRLTPTPTA